MTAHIAILGLGQIGASIGMALQGKTSLKRVGYDKDPAVARAAQSLGAVDEIKGRAAAVRGAGAVLLCLPLGEIRETLKDIVPDLAENSVLVDTAPVKSAITGWVRELLPAGRFYVGLVPGINPNFVSSLDFGLNAATPELFKKGVFAIDAPPGTPGEVVEFAFDLCRMLGAKPMLADMAESDGLMTSVHLLPQLAAAAVLNATVGQPGWADARKLAGRPYAGVTSGMAYHDDAVSLGEAALANRTGSVHALDMLMDAIQGLREAIEQGDQAGLAEILKQAARARDEWMQERQQASWLNESGQDMDSVPEFSERVGQMFFGSTLFERSRKKK